MGYCIYDNIAEMYLKVFSTCETNREWVYGNIEDNTYYSVRDLHVFKTKEEVNAIVDFLETSLVNKGCEEYDIDFKTLPVSIEAVYNVMEPE